MYKKALCLSLLIALCFPSIPAIADSIADPEMLNESWIVQYDVYGYGSNALCVDVDSNNNIIAVGITDNGQNKDAYIAKYDANGTLLWDAVYEGDEIETAVRVAVDSQDNIFVGGSFIEGASGDALILKYSKDGDLILEKRMDYENKNNNVTGLDVDEYDNLVMGGTFEDPNVQYDNDYYVIKMNNDGEILWQKTFATGGHDISHDLVIDSQSNIIQAGQSPYYGLHVIKYTENGDMLWQQPYYTGIFGEGHRVTVDANDNIYITGSYKVTNAISDFRVIKYDPDGNRLWIRDYDSGFKDSPAGIVVDEDGIVYLFGHLNYDSGTNRYDVLIVAYDSDGNLIGVSKRQEDSNDIVRYARLDKNGDIIVAGAGDGYFKVTKFSYEIDSDDDGILDIDDNCPNTPNQDQTDSDGDGQGDACDEDLDGDGVDNEIDNCPEISNPDQDDLDEDGIGDVCDPDDDNDGVEDDLDECAYTESGDAVNDNGCSIDQLCQCDDEWKNHGEYVSCIAHASKDFMEAKIITKDDKGDIISEAAKSSCGHKNKK
jgi:uncharacterized delta-60 repeat protein